MRMELRCGSPRYTTTKPKSLSPLTNFPFAGSVIELSSSMIEDRGWRWETRNLSWGNWDRRSSTTASASLRVASSFPPRIEGFTNRVYVVNFELPIVCCWLIACNNSFFVEKLVVSLMNFDGSWRLWSTGKMIEFKKSWCFFSLYPRNRLVVPSRLLAATSTKSLNWREFRRPWPKYSKSLPMNMIDLPT